MVNGTPDVTRGEFEMLKTAVDRAERRIDTIDEHGTRGVVGLQAQIVDLVKDVTELKSDLVKRFDAHDLVHKQEARDRVSARRWMVGTAVAGLASMAAVISMLVELMMHVHP